MKNKLIILSVFLVLAIVYTFVTNDTNYNDITLKYPEQKYLKNDSISILRSDISDISMNYVYIRLKEGERKRISLKSYEDLEFEADNDNVNVNDKGFITGKKIGRSTITVKGNIIKKEINVIVTKKNPDKKHTIEVKNILQKPQLPTGCEVTSLSILLNHLGFMVDKCDLADNYLTKGVVGTVTPYDAFLGNPRKSQAYGCYSPVIKKCAEKYLAEEKSDLKVYDLTGAVFEDLLFEVEEDNPVVIWVTNGLAEPSNGPTWTINGRSVTWKFNNHCMVMTGYDVEKNLIYASDPLRGNVTYDMKKFIDRFQKMGSQAIVIK